MANPHTTLAAAAAAAAVLLKTKLDSIKCRSFVTRHPEPPTRVPLRVAKGQRACLTRGN